MKAFRANTGIIALFLATAVGCASVRRPVVSTATVLVYNIHAGKDAAGKDNLARVADLIRTTGADIVLLQEVDRRTTRSQGVDQIAELARLTGLHIAFGKSLDFQGGEYGIAIMSRWPIVSDTTLPLPVNPPQERSGGSHEPRAALRAILDAPGGRIAVVNTHIDASRDPKWRLQEITTVIAITRSAEPLADRVFMGGDLNSTPESAVQDSVRNAGYRDAWQLCGKGEGFTYPADTGIKRIDYLYLDGQSGCEEASVVNTDASDHRPVLIRVRLRRS